MKVVGFTFIHNGVEGGYPFVEAIEAVDRYVDDTYVVDMESTDETRQVLDRLGVGILDGKWLPGEADRCLMDAHNLHIGIGADMIWHYEADEVFSPELAKSVADAISDGECNLEVYRLQVEQNFQRVRWYPYTVHRVYPSGSVHHTGHTTDRPDGICRVLPPSCGMLWDVTNCFRDDWRARYHNNAELFGEKVVEYRWVENHANLGFCKIKALPQSMHVVDDLIDKMLAREHWLWSATPMALPSNLIGLLGVTSYREHLVGRGLL